GTLVHPADDAGEFRPLEVECLKINRETMRIVRCRALRDETGFFQSEEMGAVLYVPEPLATQVKFALRFGATRPMEMAILHQTGSITSRGQIQNFTQPLSDWRLRIDEDGGDITVVMSAALHSAHLRDWLKSEQNFWAGQRGARVETSFTINAATRIACFGAYIPDGRSEANGAEAHPRTPVGGRLYLESAPVGPMAEFGIRDDRWVHVGSHSHGPNSYIALTEHRDVRRLPNGFLSSGLCEWPRIWIEGLSLESVASVIGDEPIRLSGEGIRMSFSNDGREGWRELASEAALEFCLQKGGLALDYFFKVGGRTVEGRVMLVWELLILRYPVLAVHRKVASIAGVQ
ncbi:hypothetical protein, partial [Qipengyuania sp. MTN3-11]|uniref:hypothetical protein n=1 Tax=Qipengyuania sp. MTN3-11 TaxID=3056557 RepID=UPI0036F33E1B